MTNQLLISLKSPVKMAGLFCLCWLLSGCLKQTDPKDATILFWTAVSENNLDEAKKLSTEGSEIFFPEKFQNLSFQTAKAVIDYDYAVVETTLRFQSAGNRSKFNTFLVRDAKTDYWKVDYKRTINGIVDKKFKNLFLVMKEAVKKVQKKTEEKILPVMPAIKRFFTKIWKGIGHFARKVIDKVFEPE